ncbi:beta-carotene 15,15'-monooxygenase [Sutcliffiella rhizosphaerae]|uniref:Beta-carotene 15,15'-monooxygenase n=1 Tax=Sutcliffiella rhizosphaerae TaxID=2880967 RepID=A0ABN8AJB8_9BACI|nr:beta-carotene 15,15'-monooxygenase [Sutcliffiella rhizosphaerae]CAG9623662.1 hypothetical protein BACCIP111883_04480 [Sutcliffiella rhizosphaerae]
MKVIKGKKIWVFMFAIILTSNYMLYQTSIGYNLLPSEETNSIVLASVIDLVILLPLLLMLYRKNMSVSTTVILCVTGCIIAWFIIPSHLLEPFATISWAGIGIAAIFLVMLIVSFMRTLSKIFKHVTMSSLPLVFSFPHAYDKYFQKNPITYIARSEILMIYYALFSWKKKPPEGMTLYKNSSYIAFQVMLIHTIVIETLGIHWWLHDKSMILSIILLLLNIYTVIFFLADIQAVRLNPTQMNQQSMFLSLGIIKRVEIKFENIECLIEDSNILEGKVSKDTIEFMARDLEQIYPDFVLKMKTPVRVTLLMGIEKEYSKIAIRSDNPLQMKEMILNMIINKGSRD